MINAEEKAKVVAAVWGTEIIQFLAVLATWHQDDFEEQDDPFLQIILAQFMLFFKSSLCKTASAERNLLNSVPQTAAMTFAFFFCIYPTSIVKTCLVGTADWSSTRMRGGSRKDFLFGGSLQKTAQGQLLYSIEVGILA